MLKSVACIFNARIESAVTALLLKKKGYNVVGVSLVSDNVSKGKTDEDAEYLEYICKQLNIPWCTYQPSAERWGIFTRAVEQDYKKGYSPDANVLYHKLITYGSLFEFARIDLQMDAMATSHYARTDIGYNIDRFTEMRGVKLLKAVDQHTDESFMLCQVKPQVFYRTLLPLGDFTREVVNKIAESVGLKHPKNGAKEKFSPDLTGNYLQELLLKTRSTLEKKSGRFLNIINWEELGKHKDFLAYEVGDTCPVKGTQFMVVDKDWKTGDIFLAPDTDHPSLYVDTMYVSLANWIHQTPYHFYSQNQMMEAGFRSQWGAPITKCNLTVGAMNEWCGNDHIILSSAEPIRGATPGKYCAFYQGEECIGSSQIMKAGPSHFALNYHKYKDTSSAKTKSSSLKDFINYFSPDAR